MKKNILKLTLVFSAMLLALLFGNSPEVHAEGESTACSSTQNNYSVTPITSPFKDAEGNPKFLPHSSIKVRIKNNCNTSAEGFNVFIGSEQKKSYSEFWILAGKGEEGVIDIPIEGTTPGKTTLTINGYLVDTSNDQVKITKNLGPNVTPITIADSAGVAMSVNPSSSAIKGDKVEIGAKFYGLKGNTFTIYIDGTAKESNIPIIDDDKLLPNPIYKWDTSGTDAIAHEIMIKVFPGTTTDNNKTIISFTINNAANDDVSNPGGSITASRLNNFNIKSLFNACSSKEDLDKILCMVTTLISWLLDISAVIAFIMILYASIIYLTSYGEESKAELAKKTLLWSVIGIIVIGAAIGLMKIIESIFQ